jgi:hypothetical protein
MQSLQLPSPKHQAYLTTPQAQLLKLRSQSILAPGQCQQPYELLRVCLRLDEVKGISLLLYLLMVRMKLKLIKQCQEPLSLIDNFNSQLCATLC